MKSILFQYPKCSYAVSFLLEMVFREGRQNLSQLVYCDLLLGGQEAPAFPVSMPKAQKKNKIPTWKAEEKSVMKYSRREVADKANPDVQHTGCLTLSCFKQLDLCVIHHALRSLLNNTNSTYKF